MKYLIAVCFAEEEDDADEHEVVVVLLSDHPEDPPHVVGVTARWLVTSALPACW
jgi:hypothetical protein